MFKSTFVNKNYYTLTHSNGNKIEFGINSCTIYKTPYIYNGKYYITFTYPTDVSNVLAMIKNEIAKTGITCENIPSIIRAKCIFRYNKFETEFIKNDKTITFSDINEYDMCNLVCELTGVYDGLIQIVLKKITVI